MQSLENFTEVIEKLLFNYKVDRTDEEKLFNFLVGFYGDGNVLTEIVINEKRIEYFGCAVREDGKWRVYNLAGFGEGVVVKMGNRPRLAVKVG